MHITVWESLFSALPCHTCRSGFVHSECAPQFRFSSGRIPRHKFIRRSSKVHGQMLVDRCSDTICKFRAACVKQNVSDENRVKTPKITDANCAEIGPIFFWL